MKTIMKVSFVLLFVFINTTDALTQEKNWNPRASFLTNNEDKIDLDMLFWDKDETDKKNFFFFAPINTLDIINPSIQFGYERRISPGFGLQTEVGMMMRHSLINSFIDWTNDNNNCPVNNQGIKLRAELKLYFSYILPNYYMSTEFFFMHNKAITLDSFIDSDVPSFTVDGYEYDYVYTDVYTVNKYKRGVNLKFGKQIYYDNDWFVDYYLGIGFANIQATHTNRDNFKDSYAYGEDLNANLAGERWVFSFPLNIKIGYSF